MKDVTVNAAYSHIRARILSGEYPPGYALVANVLGSEIGVGRTPVRHALRLLELDGLVQIRARLGASVKSMGITEYKDACAMRLALESYASGLAADNRTVSDLREMRIALDAMRRLPLHLTQLGEEKKLMAELTREDIRFHVAIMSAAKNELIKKEILRLHLINRVVGGPSPADVGWAATTSKADRDAHRRVVLAGHEQIYEAIVRRDAAAARLLMENHIQDIIDRLIRTMRGSGTQPGAGGLSDEELIYMA